jgi:hypothetical protein
VLAIIVGLTLIAIAVFTLCAVYALHLAAM